MIPNKKATSPPPKKERTSNERPKGMSQSQVPKVSITTTTQDKPRKAEKVDRVKEEKPDRVKEAPVKAKKDEMSEREKAMTQRLKEMEEKMLMISEIVKTEEEGELKLKMIAEILEVELPQQEKQEQSQPSAVQEEGEGEDTF